VLRAGGCSSELMKRREKGSGLAKEPQDYLDVIPSFRSPFPPFFCPPSFPLCVTVTAPVPPYLSSTYTPLSFYQSPEWRRRQRRWHNGSLPSTGTHYLGSINVCISFSPFPLFYMSYAIHCLD
jgi:hypothetical protein